MMERGPLGQKWVKDHTCRKCGKIKKSVKPKLILPNFSFLIPLCHWCREGTRHVGTGEMDLDEFEEAYAQRSLKTVEYLHMAGEFAYPCNCGEEECDGWAMLNADLAERNMKVLGRFS